MILDGFRSAWKGLEGFGRGWAGWGAVGSWGGLRVTGGQHFLYIFLGFAIDRSKKYKKPSKSI